MGDWRRILRDLRTYPIILRITMNSNQNNLGQTKTCPRCRRTLPVKDFALRVSGRQAGQPVGRCIRCNAAYMRNYRKTDHGRELQSRYPERIRARVSVRAAVRLGKMMQLPCKVCGSPSTEGHHPDYSKPLEVVWLCRKHHSRLHYPRFSIGVGQQAE